MEKNINLFQFAQPEYLWFLSIIPLMFGIYFISNLLKKRALQKFGDAEIIQRLMPEVSVTRQLLKFIIINIALFLIIIAVARPQYGKKLQEVTRKSAELVIAIDVSHSMEATDITPNRLDRAKKAISELLKKSQDKIAIIIFAGKAYTFTPLTADYSGIDMLLSSLSTNDISTQGTDISAAIELGMKSFSPETKKGKALIIITDGENHEEKAIEMAKTAHDKGIIVSTIGMGKTKAVPIPTKNGSFKKDRYGEKVLTKLNEPLLQQIAETGGGIYTRGNNIKNGLEDVLAQLNKLDKENSKIKVEGYSDKFMYFVVLALAFLLLEFIILERKNKRLKNIKLFD